MKGIKLFPLSGGTPEAIDVILPFEEIVPVDIDGSADFAAIPLHPLYCASLLTEGAKPFLENDIAIDEPYQRYEVIGLPLEINQPQDVQNKATIVVLKPLVLPLERLDDQQTDYGPRLRFQFYPTDQGIGDLAIQSVKGMSGGFVAGYASREGRMYYKPIAVLTAWDTTSTLYCWPLSGVFRFLLSMGKSIPGLDSWAQRAGGTFDL